MSTSARPPADRSPSRQRGVSLVELIIAIVVITVGVAGILAVYPVAVRGSADPMIAKQAYAVAEALLEEVQLAPYTYCDPDDANAETAANAAGCADTALAEGLGPEAGDARPFDNVSDYHGLNLNPISDVTGTAVAGLGSYSAGITIVDGGLNGLPAGESLLITVTVTAPNGQVYALQGYRTRYAPNALP